MRPHRMARRLLAIVLVAAFAGALVAQPAQAWFDAELRSWPWQGPVEERRPLKLAPEEAYTRYYFSVEDADGLAAAEIRVIHDATGKGMCSGQLLDFNGIKKYRRCDELQVGEEYTVVIHMAGFAKTTLWGVDV